MHTITDKKGLKAVASLEALKGLASLIVGFGLPALGGHDIHQAAAFIVSHSHLNPANEIATAFLHAADTLADTNMLLITLGACAYSLIRFVEAYGLWHSLLWTEWFALLSGAIYLPFEVYELFVHANGLSLAVLLINIVVVGYMAYILYAKKQETHSPHP